MNHLGLICSSNFVKRTKYRKRFVTNYCTIWTELVKFLHQDSSTMSSGK